MHPTVLRICYVFLGPLVVLFAGCGLAHYEAQMEREQDRLKRIDQREEYLGAPLQLPDKKGRPLVFLRPPKGIGSKGGLHDSSVLQRFGLTGEPSRFHDVSFGAETMKEDEFWSSLLHSFPRLKRDDAHLWQRSTPAPRAPQFQELTSEDGQYDSFIYVHSRGDVHVAIVFRLEKGKRDEEAKRIMEISLDSLVVGPDAPRQQRAYEASKPKTGGKGKPR
jgi:hypothetical protein